MSTQTPRGVRLLRRVGSAFVWLVVILEVLSMAEAGLGKFESLDGWKHWFGVFGYPEMMAPVVGALEVVLALALLFPRVASYAAIGLAIIMVGALHAVLTHETDLGWFDPVLHLAFLAIIGGARWGRRWRHGGAEGLPSA